MCTLCDSTNINMIIEFVPHVSSDGFSGGSDSYLQFQVTHAPCLLKLCIPPSNGIVRWWLFPEFRAELPLDSCTPTVIFTIPVYVGVVQNKPYYCACMHVLCTLHTQLECCSCRYHVREADTPDPPQEEREDPPTLAETCMRELVGRASFGHIRSVLRPVLRYVVMRQVVFPVLIQQGKCSL